MEREGVWLDAVVFEGWGFLNGIMGVWYCDT